MIIHDDYFLRVRILHNKYHCIRGRPQGGHVLYEGTVLLGTARTVGPNALGMWFRLSCDDGRIVYLYTGDAAISIERLVFEGWRSHYARVDERTIHHGE